MTAKNNLLNKTYLYAQALDNSGATEYWSTEKNENRYTKLLPSDARLSSIRKTIDKIQSHGRDWPIGTNNLTCKIMFTGELAITIRPLTLDVGNRISPILILINVFSSQRHYGISTLNDAPPIMERKLAEPDRLAVKRIVDLLKYPRWMLFLHIVFFSRKQQK